MCHYLYIYIVGSRADRGLDRLKESSTSTGDQLIRDLGECYDFPCDKCQDGLHESSCARRVPFCPGFTGFKSCTCCRRNSTAWELGHQAGSSG